MSLLIQPLSLQSEHLPVLQSISRRYIISSSPLVSSQQTFLNYAILPYIYISVYLGRKNKSHFSVMTFTICSHTHIYIKNINILFIYTYIICTPHAHINGKSCDGEWDLFFLPKYIGLIFWRDLIYFSSPSTFNVFFQRNHSGKEGWWCLSILCKCTAGWLWEVVPSPQYQHCISRQGTYQCCTFYPQSAEYGPKPSFCSAGLQFQMTPDIMEVMLRLFWSPNSHLIMVVSFSMVTFTWHI